MYGRRRVGKSRLVTTALEGLAAVYYLADERDERLQRQSLAREIERLLPGFARVEYPDWDALFDRWAEAAPAGAVLAIDELPYLVSAAPALPSILQRRIDRGIGRQHWVVGCECTETATAGRRVLPRPAPGPHSVQRSSSRNSGAGANV